MLKNTLGAIPWIVNIMNALETVNRDEIRRVLYLGEWLAGMTPGTADDRVMAGLQVLFVAFGGLDEPQEEPSSRTAAVKELLEIFDHHVPGIDLDRFLGLGGAQ